MTNNGIPQDIPVLSAEEAALVLSAPRHHPIQPSPEIVRLSDYVLQQLLGDRWEEKLVNKGKEFGSPMILRDGFLSRTGYRRQIDLSRDLLDKIIESQPATPGELAQLLIRTLGKPGHVFKRLQTQGEKIFCSEDMVRQSLGPNWWERLNKTDLHFTRAINPKSNEKEVAFKTGPLADFGVAGALNARLNIDLGPPSGGPYENIR